MGKTPKYYIVEASALPEVFRKVAEAKRLLETGEVDTVNLAARRVGPLNFEGLRRLGVVLKRAQYFITCSGKTYYPFKLEEAYILRNIIDPRDTLPRELRQSGYQQLSFFDSSSQYHLTD